jgi:hypothetical protein
VPIECRRLRIDKERLKEKKRQATQGTERRVVGGEGVSSRLGQMENGEWRMGVRSWDTGGGLKLKLKSELSERESGRVVRVREGWGLDWPGTGLGRCGASGASEIGNKVEWALACSTLMVKQERHTQRTAQGRRHQGSRGRGML